LKQKIAKIKNEPEAIKTPKKAGFDENPLRLRPAWRIGQMEFCDPYGWHQVDAATLLDIREKLRNFETMTLGQILGSKSHMVETSKLSKDARVRLEALNLDDIEALLSLRLTGTQRVWGLLEHNIVILLWWTPNIVFVRLN